MEKKQEPKIDKGMINAEDLPVDSMVVSVDIEVKTMIRDYFKKCRPPQEVNFLLENVFSDERISTMWTEDGFKNIIDYLSACPYRDVSLIISKLVDPEVTKVFILKPTDEKTPVNT